MVQKFGSEVIFLTSLAIQSVPPLSGEYYLRVDSLTNDFPPNKMTERLRRNCRELTDCFSP